MLLKECGLVPQRVVVLTPHEPRFRGAQLSLRFDCEARTALTTVCL